MHSIINLKIWKKCIKRFSKKKFKEIDSSCSSSNFVEKCVPGSELNKTGSSFDQLSLHSTDSLEEISFFFRKYGNKKSCNQQQFAKKSASLESIITNSIKSDISEDSLNGRSLSKDSLCKQMKEHIRNINGSTESLKVKTGCSNDLLLSKCQTRARSQTIGPSYQIENLFNKNGQTFFKDDQFHNHRKMASNYEKQLTQNDTLSIDSLENTSIGNIFLLNKQFISEDSLNEEEKKYFENFSNFYRKKSISDGLLHETRYFQHLLHNRDFVILNKILSSKINKQCNIENRLLKSNNHRFSLISAVELICVEKDECEEETFSIDSLYVPESVLLENMDYGVQEKCLKSSKSFSPNVPSYKNISHNEYYESEDEKLSIDSLSVPQCEHVKNKSSMIQEECLKMNKTCSPNILPYRNGKTENLDKFNSSSIIKINRSESKKSGNCQCDQYTMNDRKFNLNGPDTEKEDSISIDSLCDSLN